MQKAATIPATSARPLSLGWIGRIFPHIILIFLTFTSVMPFVWMFFGSFKTYVEITSAKTFFPAEWTFDNYAQITQRVGFPQAFLNTTMVAVGVTLATLITSAAAGYVFAKYRFWGREQVFTVLLSTMMVPFAVILVPLYITIVQMQIHNNL
ncbi:MAG: hypothetical protein NT075_21635, partial [Chloroflexi bacterium]|nr:hypothetical protein [Chloroflexota bacterium]